MSCVEGNLPFTYLGLPIGLNMRLKESWSNIIEKFKNKLSDWKENSISFGGRSILVKSVLGSMALYYFSLFRVPMSVIKELERVRKKKFGVENGKKRK